MKPSLELLRRRRKAALLVSGALAVGACFRWEVSEIADARTGQPIATHHRLVVPWQACGAHGDGRLINFHVRHWLCYGLVKVEAIGQSM